MLITEDQRLSRNAYMREWQRAHALENRARVKAWRAANPDKRKAQAVRDAKRAYDRDPEKYRARRRAYRANQPPERRREMDAEGWEWQKSNPQSYLFYNAKDRARRKGLPFSITKDDIVIPDVCPVLGIPLKAAFGKGRSYDKVNSPSLDRIIPELGYVAGNIMVISNRANSLKRDSVDPSEHRAIADYIERETARARHALA